MKSLSQSVARHRSPEGPVLVHRCNSLAGIHVHNAPVFNTVHIYQALPVCKKVGWCQQAWLDEGCLVRQVGGECRAAISPKGVLICEEAAGGDEPEEGSVDQA